MLIYGFENRRLVSRPRLHTQNEQSKRCSASATFGAQKAACDGPLEASARVWLGQQSASGEQRRHVKRRRARHVEHVERRRHSRRRCRQLNAHESRRERRRRRIDDNNDGDADGDINDAHERDGGCRRRCSAKLAVGAAGAAVDRSSERLRRQTSDGEAKTRHNVGRRRNSRILRVAQRGACSFFTLEHFVTM